MAFTHGSFEGVLFHVNAGRHSATVLQFLLHRVGRVLSLFARPFELDLDAVNVGNLLLQVIHTVSSHTIEIEPKSFEDMAMIKADPEKLTRVFLNLCKNAHEAMPEGGALVIRCYEREKNIVVEIQDTGCGVPTGINLFEPFTTSKPNGWGLGLSIVRQIILAHGGTIEYVSDLGKGIAPKVESILIWYSMDWQDHE